MTIQEFKTHIEEELRNKLRGNNESTPILNRLEKHLKDFDEYSLTDLLNPKNMKHDLYVSFLFQICFPSRIKMDIDAEYTPIKKKRIAIVSCKSKKQDYACSADEMYSPSHTYIAQRDFFIKGYDDYYILSSQYGLIHRNQIIEPYNRTVGKSGPYRKDKTTQGWEKKTLELVEKQLKYLINKGNIIDIHTSKAYYDPLSDKVKKQINYIKQPHGISLIKPRYEEATNMLDTQPLEECLQFIGHKEDKPNQPPISWYHPNHPEFFGTGWELYIKYNPTGITDSNLANVRNELTKHHKGWVIDESLLDKLYQTDSGQWRIKE